MDEITILIADDQRLMREGLRTILETESDLKVIGLASDGAEAVAMARRLKPHVILMDMRMPNLNGAEATRQIKAEFPVIQVVILTTFDDDEFVFDALKAGATGYLLKDLPSEDLVQAVRTVHRGGALIPPAIAAKVVSEFARLSAAKPQPVNIESGPDKLSQREIEVLKLVARGLNNKEISQALFITEGTVKNHISSIFSKLHMRDRTQAVLYAIKRGLVEAGPE